MKGRIRARVFLSVLALSALAPGDLASQSRGPGLTETWAGSTLESYLRYMQSLGRSTEYPFSIRSFSPDELARLAPADTSHVWHAEFLRPREERGGLEWGFISTRIAASVNTAFPHGGNDGAEWKGKGLTTSARAGAWLRWKGLYLVLAPVVFRAENGSFPLMDNGQPDSLALAHGTFPRNIDKPQRFGRSAYSRVDPGESTLRLDFRGLAAGLSSASQWWGPSSDLPIILGNNAGGFPHAFLGTSSPVSIGFGTIHGRVVYGFLEQSEYSPVQGSREFVSINESGTRRFMAGLVGVMQIRGLPGVEIGGSRFFHAAHDAGRVTSHNLKLPFQGLLKSSLPAEADTAFGGFQTVRENQLASIFLRIAPPGSGFDLNAEFGREDHSLDTRDFLLEPDHSSLVNVGVRKAWESAGRITAARAELLSYSSPGGVRSRLEGQGGAYTHSVLRQGHTHRGQLLAADVGPGSGDAQSVMVERFAPSGHWSVFARRAVAHESNARYAGGLRVEESTDVLNTIGAEVTMFRSRLDFMAGGAVTFNANRNLSSDRTNLTLSAAIRRKW